MGTEPVSQRCKGARDLLPEDLEVFRHIEGVFCRSCLSWGYREVRTPTLEYLSLFTAAGTLTPSMLNRVYSFLDWDGWSGERVVLRPDGTIPIARLYAENSSRWELARLFYVTNVFVFEETGTENRERWQCGAEFINGRSPGADVEIVSLAVEILHNLGLDNIEILLSHAGILGVLLEELRLDSSEKAKLLDSVLDGDWQALARIEPYEPAVQEFLSLVLKSSGTSSAYVKNLKALPRLPRRLISALDEFARVTELLDVLGVKYRIDITSVRGFEYYTGVCFQFLCQGMKVGSGGRYDNLLSLVGGKRVPACGFALYMDHLISLIVKDRGQANNQRIVVRCGEDTPEAVKVGFMVARTLRRQGYSVELSFAGSRPTLSCRWLVTVWGKPEKFVIVDKESRQRRRASSVDRVIEVIGGERSLAR